MIEFLFTRHPGLEKSWPFLHDRMVERLSELGEVEVVNVEKKDMAIRELVNLKEIVGIAHFGGNLTADCIKAAPKLRMVGALTDHTGRGLPLDALVERNIPIIETTRAWAQSVAELTFGLALGALRRIPQWHCRMAAGERLWTYAYGQFCDAPDFVNGTIGTKKVGVVGLGQIGRRLAKWCSAFGATVYGYDPYVPTDVYQELGVHPIEIDELVEIADIVFIAISPSPSSGGLLSRERIYKLQRGALIVITTRAQPVDMKALRERILADELAAAFDVYDIEPLPETDPLRGRDNVVHTPHIAGRTRDANLNIADIIAADFARILRGEKPQAQLTPHQIEVKTKIREIPPMPKMD